MPLLAVTTASPLLLQLPPPALLGLEGRPGAGGCAGRLLGGMQLGQPKGAGREDLKVRVYLPRACVDIPTRRVSCQL